LLVCGGHNWGGATPRTSRRPWGVICPFGGGLPREATWVSLAS
jgi:hypothetical protein